MKTNVANEVGDSSSSFASKVGVWINNRYEDFINSYPWEELFSVCSVNSTAGVCAVNIPNNFEQIVFVWDATNGTYLTETDEQEVYKYNADTMSTTSKSTPTLYYTKWDCVKNQASAANAIMAKSSSASDTTQTLLVRGIVSDVETYETLSFSGATVVTATNSYSQILALSKSAATVGKVTVYDNDGTTVIAEIPKENLISRYLRLLFHWCPSGTSTYHVRGKRRVLPLSQTDDYPAIDCATELEKGATADAWKEKRQFAKASEFEAEYQMMKQKKIFERMNRPNMIHQSIPLPLDRNEGIL